MPIYELSNGNRIVADADAIAELYPDIGWTISSPNPQPPRFWSELDFYRLFGIAKHAEILEAGRTDSTITALLEWVTAAGGCYLNAPETVQGVGYLVSVGLLTEQQAGMIMAGQAIG